MAAGTVDGVKVRVQELIAAGRQLRSLGRESGVTVFGSKQPIYDVDEGTHAKWAANCRQAVGRVCTADSHDVQMLKETLESVRVTEVKAAEDLAERRKRSEERGLGDV